MNRSLQHFLNMVLAPLDELGYGRTKVRIEFYTLALQPREFTIQCSPKNKGPSLGLHTTTFKLLKAPSER
jgi:hypothetical protein